MDLERKGLFVFSGQDVTVVGPDIQVGQKAPEFLAQTQDWSVIQALESTRGKVRIIGSLPSFSTSVCARETRTFNQEAAQLDDGIAIMMVSMDLPYTLKSWCAAAGIDKATLLSDHSEAEFGKKYGVLLKEPRVFRRAIFVVNQDDDVVYVRYMPAQGVEPDYPGVLQAARQALG